MSITRKDKKKPVEEMDIMEMLTLTILIKVCKYLLVHQNFEMAKLNYRKYDKLDLAVFGEYVS
jgi:hypothetical protein